HRTLHLIKEMGAKAGVVLNPGTPVEAIKEVLPYVDMVLLMTVNPGFGGQSFIPEVLSKITTLQELRTQKRYTFEIEIDGVVNTEIDKCCTDRGADVLVDGSAIFKKEDRLQEIEAFRNATK